MIEEVLMYVNKRDMHIISWKSYLKYSIFLEKVLGVYKQDSPYIICIHTNKITVLTNK